MELKLSEGHRKVFTTEALAFALAGVFQAWVKSISLKMPSCSRCGKSWACTDKETAVRPEGKHPSELW